MTRTIQRQDSAQDTSLSQSRVTEGSPRISASSLQKATDPASDNDTSERPVREKLKKTSIASIPKNGRVSPHAHMEMVPRDAMSTQHVEEDLGAEEEPVELSIDSRGRPLRKRSFEDFETTEGDGINVGKRSAGTSGSRARKRSRDVHVGEGLEEGSLPRGDTNIPVQELDVQNLNDDEMIAPDKDQSMSLPQNGAYPLDQDMIDSALSPRKKRSRDMDTDTYREQKIPATKGIKAMRSSDEIEPDGLPQNSKNKISSAENADTNEQPVKAREISAAAVDRPVPLDLAEAPDNLSNNSSFAKVSHLSNKTGDEPFPKCKAAFTTTGFALTSDSSTSPFGALSPSSTATDNASHFGSAFRRHKPEALHYSEVSAEKVSQARSASSGLTAPPMSLGFGTNDPSPFTSSSDLTSNAFAGATFGSGFGNTFAGEKLTSFAAPVGDAKWGGGGGVVTSFGAPAKDDENDERSESEEEGLGDTFKEQEVREINDKFQQQDVELVDTGEEGERSIFLSPRVNLYSWNGTAWKEGGRGTFKLNVPISKLDEESNLQKTGRFIMRAHQTYRVLLNTPVFKQMKIGDSKGNEPQGKSLSFAVIEDGKPTPYLIKLSDEGESKTLYREVRKLQQAL